MTVRSGGRVLAALGALALLSACASSAAPSPTAEPVVEGAEFVIDQDFPDPDVLRVGDTYYAYATNSAARNVQFATSTDLDEWQMVEADAFPELPTWVIRGKTWAPEVAEITPGVFTMYFTGTDAASGRQCIGVATSASPEGPFQGIGDGPLVCPVDEGGAIDASTFVDDDGTAYLLYKNDGNCCGVDTWLRIAPLSADGASLAGAPVDLLKQTEGWEGSLIEAPTLVKQGANYVLFYSANDYGGDQYAMGYATSAAATGPYTKHDGPFLTTDLSEGRYIGPGGQDIVTAPDGSTRLLLHSWDDAISYRGMKAPSLEWEDDEPVWVP